MVPGPSTNQTCGSPWAAGALAARGSSPSAAARGGAPAMAPAPLPAAGSAPAAGPAAATARAPGAARPTKNAPTTSSATLSDHPSSLAVLRMVPLLSPAGPSGPARRAAPMRPAVGQRAVSAQPTPPRTHGNAVASEPPVAPRVVSFRHAVRRQTAGRGLTPSGPGDVERGRGPARPGKTGPCGNIVIHRRNDEASGPSGLIAGGGRGQPPAIPLCRRARTSLEIG